MVYKYRNQNFDCIRFKYSNVFIFQNLFTNTNIQTQTIKKVNSEFQRSENAPCISFSNVSEMAVRNLEIRELWSVIF